MISALEEAASCEHGAEGIVKMKAAFRGPYGQVQGTCFNPDLADVAAMEVIQEYDLRRIDWERSIREGRCPICDSIVGLEKFSGYFIYPENRMPMQVCSNPHCSSQRLVLTRAQAEEYSEPCEDERP
jgi:hypothetical protein